MSERTYRGPHNHLVNMPCLSYWDCTRTGPEMVISFGPITGLREVARELIGHFEIDPSEHDGLLLEVEQTIGDEMLTMMREILAAREIPIPAEVDALPVVATGSNRPNGGS